MRQSEKDKRAELLQVCRFYKGVDSEYESNKYSMFASYERCWIERLLRNGEDQGQIHSYIYDGNESFDVDDGTPLSLKALLWNRYCYWSFEPTRDSFYEWYRHNYSSVPTNKEKQSRKKGISRTAIPRPVRNRFHSTSSQKSKK